MVHQMQAGIVLHHLFWLLLPPLLIQQLSKSAVCSGMIQLIPAMEVNIAQTCVVTLQCMKRCLLVSSASLHRRHLDTMLILLFCNASCVKHAFLATSQVKHFTLLGATLFHIVFQGPVDLPAASLSPFLYTLLTVKVPSLWCPQMRLSGSILVPGKFPIRFRRSATHGISQSFRSLLKVKFYP